MAYLGEYQRSVIEGRAIGILGIGETVETVPSVKAGIARRLAILHPAEEGLKSMLNAQHHILQHLAMDFRVFRHRLFDAWQFGFLLVVADGDTTHAVGF